MYTVIWKENEIGEVSGLRNDMWYLDGEWKTHNNDLSTEFEGKLRLFDINKMVRNPENGLRVILRASDEPQHKLYCLALFLEDRALTLRQLTSEEALDTFFPDR